MCSLKLPKPFLAGALPYVDPTEGAYDAPPDPIIGRRGEPLPFDTFGTSIEGPASAGA